MQDADNEIILRYGLRDKRSGQILRVEKTSETLEEYGTSWDETTYRLGTDVDSPYFTVRTEDELVGLFTNDMSGVSQETPSLSHYKPENLEPVVIEEVVTRRIKDVSRPFEIPMKLEVLDRINITLDSAEDIDGIAPVIDAVRASKHELERVARPGSSSLYGEFRMVGIIVRWAPDNQDERLWGGLMKGQGGGQPCRVLAGVPLPSSLDHLVRRGWWGRSAPPEATLLVALDDKRSLPASLTEALDDMRQVPGLKP